MAVAEGETGALLDEPRDEAEIAAKLGELLESNLVAQDERIARSVEPYEWSRVLTRYEEILSACAGRAR